MDKNYHFIAVGGIGMSGLAKYLLESGCKVSGSDICESKYITKLKDMGADIHIGHNEENLPQDSIVVVSSAIRENNPELLKAKREGMQILHRSDLLEKLSRIQGKFIGFSGTHGKTTTSGLASYVLAKGGLNPSYVVGGIIPEISTNAHYSSDDFFIAELDESDGTIVKYQPDILVVNNLEADHLDYYKEGLSSLLTTFNSYLKKLQNTIVIANSDDNGVSALKFTNRCVTFGLSSSADFMAKNIVFSDTHSIFDVYHNGEFVYTVKLTIPGRHNIYNALSVIAALTTAGVDVKLLIPYFETFSGMGRRLQKICEINGVTVYDDYAHHPTEIKAALGALRTANPDKNIVAVFQPHRYTRLKAFWQEFKTAFPSASRVVVTDVYSASEDAIEGVNSAEFVKGFDGAENYSGTIGEVAKKLLPTLKSGDIVVGLGAGTITTLGKELLKANEEIVWSVK